MVVVSMIFKKGNDE